MQPYCVSSYKPIASPLVWLSCVVRINILGKNPGCQISGSVSPVPNRDTVMVSRARGRQGAQALEMPSNQGKSTSQGMTLPQEILLTPEAYSKLYNPYYALKMPHTLGHGPSL